MQLHQTSLHLAGFVLIIQTLLRMLPFIAQRTVLCEKVGVLATNALRRAVVSSFLL